MKQIFAAAVAASLFLACGGDTPPPNTPEGTPTTPSTADMPAPPATSAAVEAPPPAKTAEEAPKPPPAPKLSEMLGGVVKVTGATPKDKKPSKTWTKAGDIEAFVKAVGADQAPEGAKPAADVSMTIEMMDKDGKVKGSMMLFNGETLQAAFMAPGGEAKAIKITDEAAVRKISGLAKPKAAAPAKAPAKPKK
jgi:hypothetical protein